MTLGPHFSPDPGHERATDGIVATLQRELLAPIDRDVAAEQLETMLLEFDWICAAERASRPRASRARVALGTCVAATALSLTAGLAAAGALPTSAQHWLHRATHAIGIPLPDAPAHHAEMPVDDALPARSSAPARTAIDSGGRPVPTAHSPAPAVPAARAQAVSNALPHGGSSGSSPGNPAPAPVASPQVPSPQVPSPQVPSPQVPSPQVPSPPVPSPPVPSPPVAPPTPPTSPGPPVGIGSGPPTVDKGGTNTGGNGNPRSTTNPVGHTNLGGTSDVGGNGGAGGTSAVGKPGTGAGHASSKHPV